MKKEFNLKLNPKNILLGLLVVYSLFASFMWYDEWSARESCHRRWTEGYDEASELRMENIELNQKLRKCR